MNVLKVLLLATLGIAIFWSLMVPMFEFPDEQAHFAMVQFLSEEGRLPGLKEKDLSIEMVRAEDILGTLRDVRGLNEFTYHPEHRHEFSDGIWGPEEQVMRSLNESQMRRTYVGKEAAPYPFLYYLYGSLAYLTFYSWDVLERLFAVRILGGILAILVVFLSYKIGLILFKDKFLVVLLATIVSLHPMLRFVMAGVTSDSLHFVFVSWGVYLCLILLRDGLKSSTGIMMGICIGLDLLTKPQGYILGMIMGIAIIMAWWKSRNWKQLLHVAGGSFIVVLLIAGWHEFPKLEIWLRGENPLIREEVVNANGEFLPFLQYSIHMLYSQNIIWYWGVFKWLGVVLPRPIWWIMNRIVLVAAVGVVAMFVKNIIKKEWSVEFWQILFLITANLLYVAAIFWFDWRHFLTLGYSLGVQGRYYLPLVVSQMALLVLGIKMVGFKWAKWLLFALFLWFVIMHVTAIWRVLSIYYDTSLWNTLIHEISQYKPLYAKGSAWWIYIGILILSMMGYLTIVCKTLFSKDIQND